MPGDVAALAVELLYARRPELDAQAIVDRVKQILPKTVVVAEEPGVLLAHEDYPIEFEEGTKAILTLIVHPDERTGVGDLDLTQSWRFRDAAEAVEQATTTLLLAEMLGSGGPPQPRIRAFRATLEAVIAHTDPLALHTPAAQEVLRPDQLHDHPLAGLVNVRLFQVTGDEEGVMLMDTLGLHTLGLADFQMHFKELDESRIAAFLFDLAAHALDNTFENGDTVGEERWRVQFEQSMVEPQRIVLDVDPGAPYAAGER